MIIIARSVGKIFEDNWKKSCPNWLLVYRPPDSAQSFDMSSKLRFSQRSPADFFMFDGNSGIFYVLECKSFVGNCSFERTKEDKGIIHYHQITSLTNFKKYPNVVSGFLLDFRKSDNTYFLDIDEFNQMINMLNKKSFNEKDILEYCNPIIIEKKKLKVNYKYDILGFIANTKQSTC